MKTLVFFRRPDVPGFCPSMGAVSRVCTASMLPVLSTSSAIHLMKNGFLGQRGGEKGPPRQLSRAR